jgi:hypothetical protein
MIEQEYILLIMNCKKYLKKAKFQRMTWLQKIPTYLRYYHVIGEEKLDNEFEFDDDNVPLNIKASVTANGFSEISSFRYPLNFIWLTPYH